MKTVYTATGPVVVADHVPDHSAHFAIPFYDGRTKPPTYEDQTKKPPVSTYNTNPADRARAASASVDLKKFLKKTIGVSFAAFAVYVTGHVLLNTVGKEIGLKHSINSMLNPDAAIQLGNKAIFSKADAPFTVIAAETCLHTKPRKSSLVEICFPKGREVRGQILTPLEKNEKPTWLAVKEHNEGGNGTVWPLYIPLKDLKAVPTETTAPKAPATAAHAKKLKPAHKL